jgi:hypothetical protein
MLGIGDMDDVLEDDVQALRTSDEAVVLDNVGVVQVLEQVDLHLHVLQVGGAQVLQTDLLDGDRLAGAPVQRAVHAAEGALAQAVAQLEVLEPGDVLGGALGGTLSAGALLAGRAIVVAGAARLLCVAGGVGRRRGLRGARVGGRVGGFGRMRHHAGGLVWRGAGCSQRRQLLRGGREAVWGGRRRATRSGGVRLRMSCGACPGGSTGDVNKARGVAVRPCAGCSGRWRGPSRAWPWSQPLWDGDPGRETGARRLWR